MKRPIASITAHHHHHGGSPVMFLSSPSSSTSSPRVDSSATDSASSPKTPAAKSPGTMPAPALSPPPNCVLTQEQILARPPLAPKKKTRPSARPSSFYYRYDDEEDEDEDMEETRDQGDDSFVDEQREPSSGVMSGSGSSSSYASVFRRRSSHTLFPTRDGIFEDEEEEEENSSVDINDPLLIPESFARDDGDTMEGGVPPLLGHGIGDDDNGDEDALPRLGPRKRLYLNRRFPSHRYHPGDYYETADGANGRQEQEVAGYGDADDDRQPPNIMRLSCPSSSRLFLPILDHGEEMLEEDIQQDRMESSERDGREPMVMMLPTVFQHHCPSDCGTDSDKENAAAASVYNDS